MTLTKNQIIEEIMIRNEHTGELGPKSIEFVEIL